MVVSEGYLHFEPQRLELPLHEIGAVIVPLAESAAEEFFSEFGEDRRVEVVLDEGSLRLRALIALVATALFKYGEIRSSLDYLWHDGKAAGSWLIEHVPTALAIPIDDIIARRSRSPAPTQLLRLFRNVQAGVMSPEEATRRAEKLFHDYGEHDETIRTVMKQLTQEIQSIPAPSASRSPTRRQPRERRVPSPTPEPSSFTLPTRRIRFFRDSRGRIRIVEES